MVANLAMKRKSETTLKVIRGHGVKVGPGPRTPLKF